MKEDLDFVWVLDTECYGYGGRCSMTESAEVELLYNNDYIKYKREASRYFKSRDTAENYFRPVAKLAFDKLIESIIEDGEEDEEYEHAKNEADEYKSRGLQENRTDESTVFECPAKHDYDRIGMVFATIRREKLL